MLPGGFEGSYGGDAARPWFMNLVCLPLRRVDRPEAIGRTQHRQMAGRAIDFIVAHESAIGTFSACSLFSPMHDFADAAGARATATAVLALLREPAPRPLPAQPARRGFLFGHGSGHGAST